ncbi:Protein ANTAGONIST OF LIKE HETEROCHROMATIN PROTEIN 1 [Frankliniella fusca]|uniref:Protein ANTAGONIST OF LIKE HETEROCHROMATIN PROTEIN 1 n=1 Tax=Frankliniella fusca TaxID=407009 RepID=A0AAE1GZJ4_9NEOP|nr:Protein ANTAGONIST OF LIKE HETEROCHROMATIN PROTEIN 1 [Frankliniella fusca]
MEQDVHDHHNQPRRRTLMIRQLEDATFRRHFRMSKEVFERLVLVVGRQRERIGLLLRRRTPVADATLMGLWVLFNPDTFRSEGLNFNKSPSVIYHHYKVLTQVLCALGSRYIKWPSEIERERTATFYERNFGFPNIVGSIDGTLIDITAPTEHKQRYVDRHGNYSMNVQIVSDHKRLIRDIYVGQPGSVNDSCVFRRSPLSRNLYGRQDLMNEDQHLIGDGGYKLTTKCRATVERLNELFKKRLSRLNKLHCKKVGTFVRHIAAAAVMHNCILLDGHPCDGVVFQGELPVIDVLQTMNDLEGAGERKRVMIRGVLENFDLEFQHL